MTVDTCFGKDRQDVLTEVGKIRFGNRQPRITVSIGIRREFSAIRRLFRTLGLERLERRTRRLRVG